MLEKCKLPFVNGSGRFVLRKRLTVLLLCLVSLTPFFMSCSVMDDSLTPPLTTESAVVATDSTGLESNRSDKLIKWATNPNYPPYDWLNKNGQYEGAVMDLLELIIPEGYVLEPVNVPWRRAQEMAKNGEIDLLVNFRVTPERSEWL